MLRNAQTLEGFELRARDGDIGKVHDLYFDDHTWTTRYLVVETDTWLNARKVLIAAHALTAREWDHQRLGVELTREQVRNSPPIESEEPLSREREEQLHRHYAWPFYWDTPMFGGAGSGYVSPIPPATAPAASAQPMTTTTPGSRNETPEVAQSRWAAEEQSGGPRLRSARAVRGFHLETPDGSLGHVEDFLLDDETWTIRSLVVDTRNWWPGKHVLLPISRVHDINWLQRSVQVRDSRATIESAPEFDAGRPVSTDYIDRLEAHHRSRDPGGMRPA